MISRRLVRLGVAMESGSRPSLGQVILLGTSSMVTAVLYSIYRQKAQVAQELKVSAGGGVGSPVSLAARAGAHRGATGPQTTRSQRGSRAPAAARLPPPSDPQCHWTLLQCCKTVSRKPAGHQVVRKTGHCPGAQCILGQPHAYT